MNMHEDVCIVCENIVLLSYFTCFNKTESEAGNKHRQRERRHQRDFSRVILQTCNHSLDMMPPHLTFVKSCMASNVCHVAQGGA